MPGRDAFLLISFGGPEGPDEVMPFLRNVTAGRDVPGDRLASVAEHYYRFGGVSPINAQCRALLAAIEKDFATNGIDVPVYWGNRNWQPYLTDTVRAMAADGITRGIAVATSAYSSFSSCRQYLDDIDRARLAVGQAAPQITKIPPYYAHPALTSAFADSTARALASLPPDLAGEADLVFTAHSIPLSMASASGPAGGAYPAQLAEVAGQVAAALGRSGWRLAYQSRSGPLSVPWLGPDIADVLCELAQSGSRAVVLVPIGFVSDHMEIRFDLDVQAAQVARELGLPLARAVTPGTDSGFVTMISELVKDFRAGGPAQVAGKLGPDAQFFCGAQCCRQSLVRSWTPGGQQPPPD